MAETEKISLCKMISKSWLDYIDTNLLHTIEQLLEEEEKEEEKKIFPPKNLIFNAFSHFQPEQTKVIIIGQDPYHKQGQAMGLSFSVPQNIKIPPSLRNIFKELTNCSYQIDLFNGDLTRWAKQGVLLLNRALTVREASPNSHQKLWQDFTFNIIFLLLSKYSNIVVMLWGGNARSILKNINRNILDKHLILECNHPSPLSANRGGWFGQNHFIKANDYLNKNEKKSINWT